MPIETEKKMKGRFIFISHLLVIEISIFLTWDKFKGYIPTKSNLALLWQWLAAWKLLKSGSHVSWRGLCVLFRIFYFRYLKLVVVFPEHFICHATEMDMKIESAEFSQKDFHSIKLKTIFQVSLFKQITWSNYWFWVVHSSNFVVLIRFHNTA